MNTNAGKLIDQLVVIAWIFRCDFKECNPEARQNAEVRFAAALQPIRERFKSILAMFPDDYDPHRDKGSIDTVRHECRAALALLETGKEMKK